VARKFSRVDLTSLHHLEVGAIAELHDPFTGYFAPGSEELGVEDRTENWYRLVTMKVGVPASCREVWDALTCLFTIGVAAIAAMGCRKVQARRKTDRASPLPIRSGGARATGQKGSSQSFESSQLKRLSGVRVQGSC